MIVVKFGGSSVANAKQIEKVANIIKADKNRKFVVVSAPGKRYDDDEKVTDLLIKLGEAFVNNKSYEHIYRTILNRFKEVIDGLKLDNGLLTNIEQSFKDALNVITADNLDQLLALGEDSSAKVVSAYLNKIGLPSIYVNPLNAGIIVSDHPGNAQILPNSYEKIYKLRKNDEIVVIPGFFGYTEDGKLVTFSRGGSDITGSIIAAGVKAKLYENFTDVDSVYSVNPQFVKNPKKIRTLTYKEMRELSYAGFSVFHDEALIPAFEAKIPVCIKNTNNPSAPGTMIVAHKEPTARCVVGIASDTGFCSIYVSKYLMNREVGFGRRLLHILEDENVSFEHMPSGIDDITIIMRENQLTAAKETRIMNRIKEELDVDTIRMVHDLAVIMVVGEGMQQTIGMAHKATEALANARVNLEMINQGSSEVSMMFGIKTEDLTRAIPSLYKAYFE